MEGITLTCHWQDITHLTGLLPSQWKLEAAIWPSGEIAWAVSKRGDYLKTGACQDASDIIPAFKRWVANRVRMDLALVRKMGITAYHHPCNYEGISIEWLQDCDPHFRAACDLETYPWPRGNAYLYWALHPGLPE